MLLLFWGSFLQCMFSGKFLKLTFSQSFNRGFFDDQLSKAKVREKEGEKENQTRDGRR